MVNVALLKVLSPAHPNLRNLSLSRLSSLFCIFRGHRIKDSLLAFDSILLITILFYYYFNCGIFYFRLANNHILHYYFDLFYLATYLYFCISYLDRNRSQTSAIFIIH